MTERKVIERWYEIFEAHAGYDDCDPEVLACFAYEYRLKATNYDDVLDEVDDLQEKDDAVAGAVIAQKGLDSSELDNAPMYSRHIWEFIRYDDGTLDWNSVDYFR